MGRSKIYDYSKEDLQELLNTSNGYADVLRNMGLNPKGGNPKTLIGKQFGVSDNAIRKHCKKFNLPYKSKEIKQFSDKEWEKI